MQPPTRLGRDGVEQLISPRGKTLAAFERLVQANSGRRYKPCRWLTRFTFTRLEIFREKEKKRDVCLKIRISLVLFQFERAPQRKIRAYFTNQVFLIVSSNVIF